MSSPVTLDIMILMKCDLHMFSEQRISCCLNMVHLCSTEKHWHLYDVIKNAPKEKTEFCFQNEVVSAINRAKPNYRISYSVSQGVHIELSYQSSECPRRGENGKRQCRTGLGIWTQYSVNSQRDLGTTPLVSCSQVPCQPLLWVSCLSQRLL